MWASTSPGVRVPSAARNVENSGGAPRRALPPPVGEGRKRVPEEIANRVRGRRQSRVSRVHRSGVRRKVSNQCPGASSSKAHFRSA